MQCFRDYKSFCPKVSEEWAIEPLAPPNQNLAPPPMGDKVCFQYRFIGYIS